MRIGEAIRCLLFLAITGCLTTSADAGVIVTVIHDPASTAGVGATSTRSGIGSWHLYAIDDGADSGISSYNIALSGTTAINHRSPVTVINDSNGDPQTAGFNLLRTSTNANPIQASQGLPGSTPFLITGLGQTASDFITKASAIDVGALVVGPTTSGAWGNYNSQLLTAAGISIYGEPPAVRTAALAAVNAGKKWIFLAEGLGPTGVTSITSAVFTLFSGPGATSSIPTQVSVLTWIIPEPASAMLLLVGLVGFSVTTRRR